MPPRRRAAAGPVPLDVDALRSALAAGRIVRVGISRSAQFPEGAIGRVKGMGYPATDGEEFIQVEVNLNGTRDVLPFTPADLTPATRSQRSTVVGPSPGNPGASNAPAAFGPPPTPTHRAPRVAQPSGPIGRQPTPPPGQGRAPHTSAEPPDVVQLTLDGSVVPPALSAAPPQDAGAARTPASDARGKRPRKGQPVSISISTSESEPPQWRVEARVGSRVAVKPTPVQAARVWELVRQLDNELLSSTVGAILEEQRRTTQARADALAAELEVVRVELDSLPPRSPPASASRPASTSASSAPGRVLDGDERRM